MRFDPVPEINISAQEAQKNHGIYAKHSLMGNLELRFRLMGGDGNGYIRTVMGAKGAWQNSHSHKIISETYIVEIGWIAIATDTKQKPISFIRLNHGDNYTTTPFEVHNVYMSPNSTIHVVKHGSLNEDADWHAEARFDALTKTLNEQQILALFS